MVGAQVRLSKKSSVARFKIKKDLFPLDADT
jgi:hypothetical protein